MRKENPMETAVHSEQAEPAAVPDRSVLDAVIAARGEIATRLDTLKERVLVRMDVKEARNAQVLEDLPERLLEQAARITRGLQGIGEYTGVEDEIANKEAAQAPAPVSGETGLTLALIPFKDSANGEQANLDALLAALDDTAAVRRDNSAVNAVIAARGKIVTRLDALKEYVLSYMDVERRDANPAEISPDDLPYMLEEAEQILSDLREIDGYAGLEEAVA